MLSLDRSLLGVPMLALLLFPAGGRLQNGGAAAAADAPQAAASLKLFGVEIGGPEDQRSLTDASAFESARQIGAQFIDLRPIWSTLEPRPGQYDWATLDAAMRNAAAVKLPVTITMRFFEQQIPEWLAGENMIDQDGKSFFGYGVDKSRTLSYWGPQGRRAYLALVEALIRRYRANRAILAWQFFYGYNDSFYLGMWQNTQTIYDYSTWSQAKYRTYLSTVKKYSLGQLNKRYGTNYGHWASVVQPRPMFNALNVTPAWHDFQEYRMWSVERMFDDIYRTVRALDARPLIMYFGGSLHHSAHQLTVYDIGLRLLRKHGGALDITCFEDPVPAEIGAGIVRSYGVPLMAEAWQVPPPLPDFRRLFFHAFSLGVKSYQMVGNWEKMQISKAEFQRTRRVFTEMAEARPVRAAAAGLFSYRSIQSHIPARNYINPTLAMIPKLQEHQYSLDWHSDMSPLDGLERYPALLDANSEVLERSVIRRLVRYVDRGGRLVLLARSGRYALEEGRPDYPLLSSLRCPNPQSREILTWRFGKGQVMRVGEEMDWKSDAGTRALLKMMEWMQIQRPITGTPGMLASLSRGPAGEIYATLLWPNPQPGSGTFRIREGALKNDGDYRVVNLFAGEPKPDSVSRRNLERGLAVSFGAHELKVLKLTPE